MLSLKKQNELIKLHRCHVCGKIDTWNKDWATAVIYLGNGYTGYEINFVACSNHCRKLTKDCKTKQFEDLYNRYKETENDKKIW